MSDSCGVLISLSLAPIPTAICGSPGKKAVSLGMSAAHPVSVAVLNQTLGLGVPFPLAQPVSLVYNEAGANSDWRNQHAVPNLFSLPHSLRAPSLGGLLSLCRGRLVGWLDGWITVG